MSLKAANLVLGLALASGQAAGQASPTVFIPPPPMAAASDGVRDADAVAALTRAIESLRGTERIEAVARVASVPGAESARIDLRWQRDGVFQLDMVVLDLPSRVHVERDVVWMSIEGGPWHPVDPRLVEILRFDAVCAGMWANAGIAQQIIDRASNARLLADAPPDTLRVQLDGFPRAPEGAAQPSRVPARIVLTLDDRTYALREVQEFYVEGGRVSREFRVEHRPVTFTALTRD